MTYSATAPCGFDPVKIAHEIAEHVARQRILKYHNWAPCNPPNTPLAKAWLVERNTRAMARYSLYLEARGLLDRHSQNPKWIRLKERL